MTKISSSYEVVLRPKQPWMLVDWRGIIQYRDLFWEMVRRDFSARYKQTILGPAWFVINPLITTVMFILVFNKVAGMKTNGENPILFYQAGLLGWNYFSQTLGGTGNTLSGNIHLFGKVYFPRLIVPLTVVASNLVSFFIQLATLAVIYVFLGVTDPTLHARPTLWILAMPLVILHTAVLALGVGLLLSSLSAKYKDFAHLTGFLLNLWMYASPVIWSLKQIPEKWHWLVLLNPVTGIIEALRFMLLGSADGLSPITAAQYGLSVGFSLLLCAAGIMIFQRTARTFIDYA